MDRDAVARAGRRAEAQEALADEREREAALRQQVAEVVLEQEGARVDAEAFAGLEPDAVSRVRAALGLLDDAVDDGDEDPFVDDLYVALDDEPDAPVEEDELARLEAEIAESQRIQQALEHYIAALDSPAPTAGG